VQCKFAGAGLEALTYLARYLYKGVILEKNIVSDEKGFVTFRYKESETQIIKTRKLKGEDFLWEILQHVLPKGFRRTRNYGFLHGNAKAKLRAILLLFGLHLSIFKEPDRTPFKCPKCSLPMTIISFYPKHISYG